MTPWGLINNALLSGTVMLSQVESMTIVISTIATMKNVLSTKLRKRVMPPPMRPSALVDLSAMKRWLFETGISADHSGFCATDAAEKRYHLHMADTSDQTKPALWRWDELSSGLCGSAVSGPDITGVGVDSRSISSGELFIALPGDPGPRFNPSDRSQIDGHDFIQSAAGNGAAGAMVHKVRGSLAVSKEFPLLEVRDTYDGLWQLGAMARARLDGDVLAVTGSSGKTTAKHFLAAALAGYAPPGSFNNHIGVPLSLANAPPASPAAIFEIGTNHPGEIEPLAEMVKPNVAILLNVHSAHIENFRGLDELRSEKISIFNSLEDKSNAISEDEINLGYGLTFGVTRGADARVEALHGDLVQIDLFGKTVQARVPGGGVHRARTVAATLLACHVLQRDFAAACDLPSHTVPSGRGNILHVGDVVLVDDSYNANPDSMRAALQSFAKLDAPQPKIAVVGEMLELGDTSGPAHLGLAEDLAQMDEVYCVGVGTRELARTVGARWFELAGEELIREVVEKLGRGSGSIFVKGSNRVFWQNQFVNVLLDTLQAH